MSVAREYRGKYGRHDLRVYKRTRQVHSCRGQHIPIGALPFYNGKTYMISSDSIMPEPFAHLFKTCHISAGIFEPIEIQKPHGDVFFACMIMKNKNLGEKRYQICQ